MGSVIGGKSSVTGVSTVWYNDITLFADADIMFPPSDQTSDSSRQLITAANDA